MDNDLMARRLRPPSEPPRPQNGHSPLPPEAAPWTAAPESAAEVPWDRPAAEPWPPTTDDARADLWDEAPATHAWPPAPATEETPDVTDIAEAPDSTETTEAADYGDLVDDQNPEPLATSEGPMQPHPLPRDTEAAPTWGGPAPWDPQPMTAQADSVAETETPSAPEDAALEPEVEADVTDLSVPGRPSWDVPAFAAWDEAGAVDDRPSEMLDAFDEMIPVVTQRVAEAQAAAAEPTAPVESEPAVEAEASVEPEPAVEAEASVEPEPVVEAEASVEPEPAVEAEASVEPEPAVEAEASVEPEPAEAVASFEPESVVEPEPVVEAEASVEPEPAVEAEASVEPEPAEAEPQSQFTWPSLLDASWMPEAPSAEESEPAAAASEPVAEVVTTTESEPAPWSDFVEGPRELDVAPTWLTQYSLGADEPVATSMTADPYDAEAPVLDDVEHSAAPMWLEWSPASDANPVVPSAVGGKILGPTPPDDLFEQPASPVLGWLEPSEVSADPTADVTYHEPEPQAESDPEPGATPADIAATTMQSLVFSTGPGQPPLVLRIELAIVDKAIQLRSADTARRVGPWSDEEPVTARHPEFEPRTHAPGAPVADNEPAADASVPWAVPADAHWSEVVDLPWDLPALMEPNPTAAWTLDSAPADPLASLPAATFASPAPTTRPAEPPHADPPAGAAPAAQATTVDASASAVQSVALASTASTSAVATTRPQTNPGQSDLWFLASEPVGGAADVADPTKIAPTSTAWTTILTIGMAVVVILLVLFFVYLMTSLLH